MGTREAIGFLSASEIASRIRARKLSASEVVHEYLARIDRYNGRVNAVVALDRDNAVQRAKAADEAQRRGEIWGPLHGVPITIKDTFDVKGLPSTWGVSELRDNRPGRNALAVDRFINAGAIVLGKTNVPAYLIGWSSENDIYGITNNPWDLSRSPGGPSGGAAAALAAGLTTLDLGVDFNGGVRNPAHYCGVYGFRPTYGVTNLVGHLLPGIGTNPDMAVVGPLARCVADIRVAAGLIMGPAPEEARAWTLNLPKPRIDSLKGLRVAVMSQHPTFPVADDVRAHVERMAEFMAKIGAEIDETARPAIDMPTAFRIFGGLVVSRLVSRAHDEEFWRRQSHLTSRFFPADKGSSDTKHWGPPPISHAQWLELDNSRHLLRKAWAQFFEDFDVLLCPCASTAAVCYDTDQIWHERIIKVKGKSISAADQTFWGGFTSVAHLPSIAVPAGFTPTGLPVGVQIVGPEYGDLMCLQVAEQLEREFCGFTAPPGWE